LAPPVFATSAVNWITPLTGASFPVDTIIAPTGIASGIGTTGEGLDLALVLDSSASMTALVSVNGVTQTRAQWQKDAAIAMVENLPTTNVAVAVVEFDYYSSLLRGLSPLSTDKDAILAAINAVDASGGTFIGKGIDVATAELSGINHTAGWVQQMVVFSDGYTAGVPAVDAAEAVVAGVDAVHAIALPGADLATMQNIATAGNGTFIDASTPNGLQDLLDRFSGLGGSLVGIDHVDISMPDGTFVGSIVVDALGNFQTPEWLMQLGPNQFLATAYAIDGSSAAAPLLLYGTSQVAEPNTFLLLGLGLLGLVGVRRKR
jgi:hypothetical protein